MHPEEIMEATACVFYFCILIFCLTNIFRFWRLRTLDMGILYSLAALNLLLRCAFFVLRLLHYAIYWQLLLIVTSEVFSICVVI